MVGGSIALEETLYWLHPGMDERERKRKRERWREWKESESFYLSFQIHRFRPTIIDSGRHHQDFLACKQVAKLLVADPGCTKKHANGSCGIQCTEDTARTDRIREGQGWIRYSKLGSCPRSLLLFVSSSLVLVGHGLP